MAFRTFARSISSQYDALNKHVRGHTRLRPRRRNRHIQSPNLPTYLLLPLSRQTAKPHARFSDLLFKEFDGNTPSDSVSGTVGVGGCREVLAHEGVDARVDQGFEFDIVYSWEGEVEDFDGAGADGREVSVEEDEVQDAYCCVSS